MGKPMSRRMIVSRSAQEGRSHAGKTADARLDGAARHDRVGHRDAIDFTPLNFFEKSGHRSVKLADSYPI